MILTPEQIEEICKTSKVENSPTNGFYIPREENLVITLDEENGRRLLNIQKAFYPNEDWVKKEESE